MREVLSKVQSADRVVSEETPLAAQSKLKLRAKSLGFWLALVLFMTTVLEGIVFNHFYFRFALGDYQTVTVPLPYHEQLGENAYVFSPQQRSLVLQGLDIKLMTVGFKLKGEHTILNGTIALSDDGNLAKPVFANTFKAAPSDVATHGGNITQTPGSPYKVLVLSKGNAHSVALSFEQINSVVVLTDLTLNVAPTYSFSLLRWLGMTALGALLVLILYKRFYELRVCDLDRRSFRLVQALSLGLCLAINWGYSYMLQPSHISPTLLFDYLERGYYQLGNPKQSLLLDFPKTQKEIEYHDPYVQNLDAWLKGQLNLDVAIGTDVLNAAHDERIYDPSWRAQNGIEGLWDRSFYDGKFYAYYGYGPMLMLHLPLYLITRAAPSPSLAVFYFSTLAILGLYLGIFAVARFYGILSQANVLIWGLVQVAAVLGTHLIVTKCTFGFYAYASILSVALLGLLTYLLYTVPITSSVRKKRFALVAIGIVVVLIVQTRPFSLFYAMALSCPVFWALIRANARKVGDARISYGFKDKLLDATCVGVPVAIGAVITMALNYLRFDSVFEFGQRLCLTWQNQLQNGFYFSLEQLSAMVELYFTRSWVDLVDFPFYGIARDPALHIGNFMPGHDSVGIFASPVWWGLAFIFLLFCFKGKAQSEPSVGSHSDVNRYGFNLDGLLKVTLAALYILLPVILYTQLVMFTFGVRFLMENLAAFAAFAVLLWCRFISFEATSSLQAKVFYWAVIWCLAMTVVMEAMAPLNVIEHTWPYLVPDEWVSAQAFFMPISTVP